MHRQYSAFSHGKPGMRCSYPGKEARDGCNQIRPTIPMAMAGLAGGRMDDGVLHKLDQWQKNRHFGNWTGAVRHGGVMDEMPTFGQLERAPVNTKACGRPILEAGLIRELDLVGSTGWIVSGCAAMQGLTSSSAFSRLLSAFQSL